MGSPQLKNWLKDSRGQDKANKQGKPNISQGFEHIFLPANNFLCNVKSKLYIYILKTLKI
jgi:hypothetical protein